VQRRIAGYRARIGRDELIVKTVEKGVETIPFFYPFIQCRRTRYVSRVAASMWQKNFLKMN